LNIWVKKYFYPGEGGGIFIRLRKVLRCISLICLMLASAFAGSELITLKAASSPYFSIEACVTDDPYWGPYGGYHDIWFAIQHELAKINITLTIEYNDMYGWWRKVWEDSWNYSGDFGPPPYGWDVTLLEWWLQPHAIEPWFASMILNNQTPIEGGLNIHPWMNKRADTLVLKGLTSFDAATRKNYLWGWQEEWMHDPPIAEIYYPRLYEARASYVLGYDPTGCRWHDVKHLDINETEFELAVGPGGSHPNSERYEAGNDTLFYAVSDDVWGWSPMFTETCTEKIFGVLCYDTLYTWSLNWTDVEWLSAGIVEPDYWDYVIKPELAAGDPIPVGGNQTHLRIPLREGVLWSDVDPAHPRSGTPFNATDVKFTFDCTLNPEVACFGYGDFAYLIERVEVVPLNQSDGGTWCPYTEQYINASAIDFVLKFLHPDFKSVLSNGWGGGSILPWTEPHEIIVYDHPDQVVTHPTNTQWYSMHPGTGPYIVTDYKQDQYIKLEKNDLHWGYDLGYGPHVSTIILKWVPDAATRLIQIQNNDIDLGEYPVATVDEYEDMKTWDNLIVFEYDYPASNGVWFNFNNPYLSNRYVRQAIAHAIPYQYIYVQILKGWGIKTAYPGKTYILPKHYYEGEHLFHETLPPYEYDLAKAAEYLKMWLYAQPAYAPYGNETDPDPTGLVAQGPVGDANLDGIVNFDDFFVFAKWRGTTPATWVWDPGCDIDPDFDNDEAVSHPEDFDLWWDSWGNEYPFEGAR
jgi:ABC-type transport system substrate-binding protein